MPKTNINENRFLPASSFESFKRCCSFANDQNKILSVASDANYEYWIRRIQPQIKKKTHYRFTICMTSQRVKGYHNKNFFCYDRSILSSSIPHYLIVNWAAMHMKLLLKSKITYNANRADRYNAPSNIYNSTAVRHFRYFHFQKKKKRQANQLGYVKELGISLLLFSNQSKLYQYLLINCSGSLLRAAVNDVLECLCLSVGVTGISEFQSGDQCKTSK